MLTQDEWNEKQRAERKSEFSWKYNDNKDTLANKSKLSNYQHSDSDNSDGDDELVGPSPDMFFTTASNPNKQTTIKSKDFKQPIYNELDDEPAATNNMPFNDNYADNDDDLYSIPLPSEPRKGAEVAPPPTYEYYGPSGRGPKAQNNFINVNEMQESISKGFENANSRSKPREVRDIVDD